MALQGVFFYGAALIILYDFISFIMYFPIILWFVARVSDAHARKQNFFLGGGGMQRGCWKREKKLWNIFFPHLEPLIFVCNLSEKKSGIKGLKCQNTEFKDYGPNMVDVKKL